MSENVFQPSPQQRAVFDAITSADHNILVDAKAGSGKTTTIFEGMRYIPRGTALLAPSIVFLAFNKNIAETLKARCPTGVSCSTFHSLGFRALKDFGLIARNVKVDGGKARKLVWNALDRDDSDVQRVCRLVDVAKGEWPTDLDNPTWWANLIRRQDLSFEQPRRAVEIARSVVDVTTKDHDVIDFADMLYMPVAAGVSFDPMDWIFVDEAQDLNGVQHEIVGRLCRAGKCTFDSGGDEDGLSTYSESPTRLVAVGDPHQAIYAFRGAHSDSMERLATRFSCRSYPLSVSYRCSKAVVKEAQKFTTIEPHLLATDGHVTRMETYNSVDFPLGSVILCRNTAPLVAFTYALLQHDVHCKILGRDIGKQLSDVVKKMRAVNLEDFLDKLAKWVVREVERAEKDDRSPERIYDQSECLRFFVDSLDEDSRSVASLLAKIELMFTDNVNGDSKNRITLSTIHKAKGLEFPTVFLLDWHLLPSRYAKQKHQLQQEKNLQYVAITRSMDKIFYINSGGWKS